MKFSPLPAAVIFAAISIATVSAQEKPFSFKVEGDTLHIYSPDGKEVGTGLPTATIGKTVSAPPYSFQVSFGTDANGSLSVIVTPDPEHPAPLNFTLNNQQVHMDKGSVATLTLGSDGSTHVDGGLTGGVKVDNRPAPSPTVAANTPATAAPTAPTAPSAPTAQNMPAGTVPAAPSAPNSPLGSLTPDGAPAAALPTAGTINTSAVAAEVVNNPQIATTSNTTLPSNIVVVQTPAGLAFADSTNPTVAITISPKPQVVSTSTGAAASSASLSAALASAGNSVVNPTTSGSATTPF